MLGGTSTFIGPIVGGLVLGALPEVLRFLAQYRGVFNGLVLLLVIVYLPGGMVNPAGWRRAWRRLRGASERCGAVVPSAGSSCDSYNHRVVTWILDRPCCTWN